MNYLYLQFRDVFGIGAVGLAVGTRLRSGVPVCVVTYGNYPPCVICGCQGPGGSHGCVSSTQAGCSGLSWNIQVRGSSPLLSVSVSQ